MLPHTTRNLHTLPDDMLILIGCYLDYRTLAILAAVHPNITKISGSDLTWSLAYRQCFFNANLPIVNGKMKDVFAIQHQKKKVHKKIKNVEQKIALLGLQSVQEEEVESRRRIIYCNQSDLMSAMPHVGTSEALGLCGYYLVSKVGTLWYERKIQKYKKRLEQCEEEIKSMKLLKS